MSSEAQPSRKTTGRELIGVSDDLTGAVAMGGELRRGGLLVRVLPWEGAASAAQVSGAFVIDTSSRLLAPHAAAERLLTLLHTLRDDASVMYKRIDSELRGPVAAELAAWHEALGRPALVAPAAPAYGVTTVDGVQLVGGQPVSETRRRHVSSEIAASAELRTLLPDARTLGLAEVRCSNLARSIATAFSQNRHVVCDAETFDDLRTIADAAARLDASGVAFSLVGSYGFAEAWAKARRGAASRGQEHGVLIISDSLKLATIQQLSTFSQQGGPVVVLDWAGKQASSGKGNFGLYSEIETWAALLRSGNDVAISTVDPAEPLISGSLVEASTALAAAAVELLSRVRPTGIIAIGGELASAFVRLIHCYDLEVEAEPWPTTPVVRFRGGLLDGMTGVLKSGGQGDPYWLSGATSLVRHLNKNLKR